MVMLVRLIGQCSLMFLVETSYSHFKKKNMTIFIRITKVIVYDKHVIKFILGTDNV